MKLSDYVAKRIADAGIRHVFMITGGGAMHLNDSIGHEPRIRCIFNHHEQASAMAAEGYARASGKTGCVCVTTGPGGINALNGVFGAWTDSIPMLIISGQVKRETCVSFYGQTKLRQLGDQEADVISMAKGITKYAVLLRDPAFIRYHLERALHLAITGRPGPCWIDIPVDLQAAHVDPEALPAYNPAEDAPSVDRPTVSNHCRDVLDRIEAAGRPVVMVGTGIRLAGAIDVFQRVIRRLGVPVTTAWTAHDLLPGDDPLFCGRPGTVGDRPGNFTVQNSDVLLVIGSRLNIRQVSYNWKTFAREAFKIQVDVDSAELTKPTVKPDLPVLCDAKVFLEEIERQMDNRGWSPGRHDEWVRWCRERVSRYPVVLPRHRVFNGRINPYHFVEEVWKRLADDDMVVCGNGTACVVPFQVARIRGEQRLWCNSGDASMGYDLPVAIGATVARGGKRVICFAGDGSLQMNLQELQTVAHYRLTIKLFVLNNNGYVSIRQTQAGFFGRFVGESPATGVTFPDIVAVAKSYGLPAFRIDAPGFGSLIDEALAAPHSLVCEAILDPEQPFEPKLASKVLAGGRIISPPLEDMYPFLDRRELLDNLLISPAEE